MAAPQLGVITEEPQMSYIINGVAVILFAFWVLATIHKRIKWSLVLGVALMLCSSMVGVTVNAIHSHTSNLDLTSSCRIIVDLLKDGKSQEVVAAIGPCLPDPNSSRGIDIERLYFSLDEAMKKSN